MLLNDKLKNATCGYSIRYVVTHIIGIKYFGKVLEWNCGEAQQYLDEANVVVKKKKKKKKKLDEVN